MKTIGIILSVLVWVGILGFGLFLLIVGYNPLILSDYPTIKAICCLIVGGYVGNDCYKYSGKFYDWFKSNLR